ncbi:DHA2 family efflux MFS transporter permease subunit [Convivina praedatoris]|uniref:DHA2 family efflux MFS transporter permease subunit n=1 Tax=Convivina praedatoris TaxID=2880963 RepID=UPI00200EF950|nr:DHA2 family efflux MFS transporter permease subunit [Convivina sp. LMG 32447]CAH1851542.1 putative multidrug resistance protein EmrY [Convivina sp. LMG 32447]
MKKGILITLCVLGIFICMLDTTIMNVSLPNISQHLGVGLDDLSWALNVYLIIFAALTIPLTRLAEIFGTHRGFLIGVSLFGVGSTLSAAANNLTILLVGRAIQSMGAALVFPLSMTLGIKLVDVKQRTGIIALLGITQGLAAALGPTVGGLVTQFLSWRWIFLINIPITIVMLILGILNLNLHQAKETRQSLDATGAILSIITLTTLSLGMMQGRSWGWLSVPTVMCFVVCLLAFALFLLVESKSSNPMVPLSLFKDRNFSIAAGVVILSNLFLVATTVILPTYFTNITSYDSLHAALLVAPISLAIFIFSPIAGFALNRVPGKYILVFGFIMMAIGFYWLGHTALTSQSQSIWADFTVGMGYGIVTGPILVIAAGHLQGRLLTASQSVTGVLRQVGIMLAVAIFVTGLYANLDIARANSRHYAQESVAQLALPKVESQRILGEVEHRLEATQFIKSDTSQLPNSLANCITAIEKHTQAYLRQAFEKLYLVSLPFVLLGGVVALFLKRK